MKRRRPLIICLILLFGYLAIVISNGFSTPPVPLGVVEGQLAKCPDSKNCVSTQTTDPEKQMPPIPYAGSPEDAKTKLQELLAEFPNAKMVDSSEFYLRYEFTSRIMRYIDDVEFVIAADESVIHFRSASRVGYSDLGANRNRMEIITRRFN